MGEATITVATSETGSAVCWGFEAVGASVGGAAHDAIGQPCQDRFAIGVGEDWVVAIVSDGAGSAARALDGARIVSEQLCRELTDFLKDNYRSDLPAADLASGVKGVLIQGIERARQCCVEQ